VPSHFETAIFHSRSSRPYSHFVFIGIGLAHPIEDRIPNMTTVCSLHTPVFDKTAVQFLLQSIALLSDNHPFILGPAHVLEHVPIVFIHTFLWWWNPFVVKCPPWLLPFTFPVFLWHESHPLIRILPRPGTAPVRNTSLAQEGIIDLFPEVELTPRNLHFLWWPLFGHTLRLIVRCNHGTTGTHTNQRHAVVRLDRLAKSREQPKAFETRASPEAGNPFEEWAHLINLTLIALRVGPDEPLLNREGHLDPAPPRGPAPTEAGMGW